MTLRIVPNNIKGFIIEKTGKGEYSFVEQPIGNVKSPSQVIALNLSLNPPEPAKRQLTRIQVDAELRAQFKEDNNIEEI